MKIAIVTCGTRGDVQPYVALARALMDRGHRVTLSTHAEYGAFIRAHGVEPGPPLRDNFRALLESDLGRRWLESAGSPREYARHGRELLVPLQARWCEDADAAVEGADAVLFYVLAPGALHAADRRGLPAVVLAPWPMVPSREIAPVGAVWLDRFPGFVKRAAGHEVLSLAFGPFNEVHNDYRRRVGVAPFRERNVVSAVLARRIPGVHLFSESVLARPADWPAPYEIAGFPFLPPAPFTPPDALADFLAAGPPPVYVGFGSMTGFAPEELSVIVTKAARLAGVRVVLARGWAGLTSSDERVHVVDETPHDWLFPRVAAVVHHGGVGTFHEALRAGRPNVIMTFFGDQPFWALLNRKLGTGPRALARSRVTAERLAAAIRAALGPDHRARAEALGARLRAEPGAARAAERIERIVTSRRSA
ncbi:MAG: glycosyltransferase family 1 protein [Labilithrix sp.]|nr:glycosyltransferase family 1 protein [Labilithrix sp.]MCW5812871.1 glycosyltransferase family 1 protein [Labilithrix sp.]